MGRKAVDMLGATYGKLTVIERAGFAREKALWRCVCTCGNEALVSGDNLRKGNTKSCGCNKVEHGRHMVQARWNKEHASVASPDGL